MAAKRRPKDKAAKKSKGWDIVKDAALKTRLHVMPIDDDYPHVQGMECECRPLLYGATYGDVLVHNSYDRREDAEETDTHEEEL